MDAKPIGAILEGVLQQTAKRQETLHKIQRAWSRLVGPALATHTRPRSLRKGTLVVEAECPGDAFTWSYERARILARVQEVVGAAQVNDIILRPGESHGSAAKKARGRAVLHR